MASYTFQFTVNVTLFQEGIGLGDITDVLAVCERCGETVSELRLSSSMYTTQGDLRKALRRHMTNECAAIPYCRLRACKLMKHTGECFLLDPSEEAPEWPNEILK